MYKPVIGIIPNMVTIESGSWAGLKKISLVDKYISSIELAGGLPIVLPLVDNVDNIPCLLDLCDGLLVSGGNDIHPIFFNEQPHKNIGDVNYKIDKFQIELTKLALERNLTFLGICKGLQVLNVACGGSLYQDLSEVHKETIIHHQKCDYNELWHKVKFNNNSILYDLFGKEIWVNSYHHQAIKYLGENLKVTSTSYDGIIEGVEMADKDFVVGVQFHPELMVGSQYDMIELFKEFINKCK
ncbi:gamma-glutamyl-gamma-aminobutyrate hydrolase family protein [Romboutsia sp.]|uniref:gamma-glutamyl-gamma-aminobutyrate hydrolase family protein n=1 Tax=Romboutsia sp. TaxID=1965302 RepID=UPI003F3B7F12